MSTPTLDQAVMVLATERPELLSQFSRAELREQLDNFVAALVVIGRQRTAEKDPGE